MKYSYDFHITVMLSSNGLTTILITLPSWYLFDCLSSSLQLECAVSLTMTVIIIHLF